MNGTRRRGIGSKFGTPWDVPQTEEEAKEDAKVWENGWVVGSLEYARYQQRTEGPDAPYVILVFGASVARLGMLMVHGSTKVVVRLLRQVPSLTRVVVVDDEGTHVSPSSADLVAHFVYCLHQRCILCLCIPHLPAELATELCLSPTHEPSFPAQPLFLLTLAPCVFVIGPPFVVDGVPRRNYWHRSGMNLALGVSRVRREAWIVVAILEVNWFPNLESVAFRRCDNELACC